MHVTPLHLFLGGIISLGFVADSDDTCCPCAADRRASACTRAAQQCAAETPPAATEILAFEAAWCGPCQKMVPVLRALEKQGVSIRRINVDENRALAKQYHVTSLPTMVKLVKGRETGRLVGMSSAGQVTELAEKMPLRGVELASPRCCEGRDCSCANAACEIPAATKIETLIRATYKVPAAKAAALVGLLEQTAEVPIETKIEDGKLTITTTPAAQRTIGAFIDAFLRGASENSLSACST